MRILSGRLHCIGTMPDKDMSSYLFENFSYEVRSTTLKIQSNRQYWVHDLQITMALRMMLELSSINLGQPFIDVQTVHTSLSTLTSGSNQSAFGPHDALMMHLDRTWNERTMTIQIGRIHCLV